ncbi:MAG: glycosyltransferase family 39 protein [Gemmatimonadota bacterium]|nr:glycosyltransferase family 39 protein [Gemmatimonadota bacterium]
MTEPAPPTEVDPFERYGTSIAIALVIVGFVLRARGLSEYWLNPDEGIYYSTLTRDSIGAFWAEVSANAHPPLFYLVMRGVGLLTWDFVWLRVVSLISGTVAIWAFWLVGRELGGRGRAGVVAGLVSATLLSINAYAVTLSQVIRPYMMMLALLALGLFHLLRYRSDPSGRRLALYAACLVPAVLIHYSAVLALAGFCIVAAYYALTRTVEVAALRRLALVQIAPALVFVALYMRHVATIIDSDLMGDALDADGWLTPWLVATPGDAWYSFATFQAFHVPPDFRGRAALLLLVALAVALARDRLVAVITGAGLTIALTASVLGLYPFGPTRHDAWLIVFTLPALGWLVGCMIELGPRAARIGAGVLAVALVAGGPLERVFGADLDQRYATEEQVIRQSDLATMVVSQMDPQVGPATVLMTEQSYNLLMPLYVEQRQDARFSPDSTLFAFPYGSRMVVVARKWDWDGLDDAVRTIANLPSVPGLRGPSNAPVLVMAGGWGSLLFADIPRLEASGALLEAVRVLGRDAAGRPTVRMMGMVLDGSAIRDPA